MMDDPDNKPIGEASIGDVARAFGRNSIVTPNTSHSLGYRDNVRPGSIARSLLNRPSQRVVGMDEKVDISSGKERFLIIPKGNDRPLIDMIQWGTFGDLLSMQYAEDKYRLRELLRKAHCFTMTAETSRLVADFSVAIASDIEAVRPLAVPPFPVTWIEVDNNARLDRLGELGISFTVNAQPGNRVDRVGWLITEARDLVDQGGYYATYCCMVEQGPMVAPLSYFWHTRPSVEMKDTHPQDRTMQDFCWGIKEPNVTPLDAFPTAAPWQLLHRYSKENREYGQQVYALMREIQGELRHIFGALVALNAGAGNTHTETKDQPKTTAAPLTGKGKPLFPLEHKVLHIKLGKRRTVEKAIAMAVTGIKHRRHEVRGHFRTKYNEDGSVKWRIEIKAHERGDERLGRITKTYRVEK